LPSTFLAAMPVSPRLLSMTALAILLFEAKSLVSVAGRRGKRCLAAQIQIGFLLFVLKQIASLDSPRMQGFWQWGPLQALSNFSQSAAGALVQGAIVPTMLAIAGLPFIFGETPQRRRWLMRVLIYGSAPTLVDAVEERFGEAVDTIAVLAFELGLLLDQHGASAVILLMLSGGEALEHHAFARARRTLKHILDQDLPPAHRVRTQANSKRVTMSIEVEDVDANEIREGDILMVRAGEVVPVDGCLVDAGSEQVIMVDDSLVSGEVGGTPKHKNDSVFSGSVAQQPLWLSATAPFQGSTLALMRNALQDALERKGQLQQRSATAATVLQPLTLTTAAAALIVRTRSSAKRRWHVVLSVLMAATPCPASIGVPVAYLSGMSIAARHGVLVKSGSAVEALARATHVVLDKTGTLTQGVPNLRCFEVLGFKQGEERWKEVLQLVASVEVGSTHPLAAAICALAEAQGTELLPATDQEHAYGCGVVATVDGHHVIVGNLQFVMSRLKTAGEAGENACVGNDALLEVHFSVDGQLCGHALFEDPIREGSQQAIARLRKLGLQVSILSGDPSAHLAVTAKKVGIDTFKGGCLPQEKARLVTELGSNGCVVMVGDEGNDAPALAAANVGISVGTSGLASQSADVVVAADPSAGALERVACLISLCRTVVATATRGVHAGLGVSALQVVLAGIGFVPPGVSAVMQEVVDVSALANAVSVLGHRWSPRVIK